MAEEKITYTVDELRDWKTGLDKFFAGQPEDAYEFSSDVRPGGWSSHFKLANKQHDVTPNLIATANITHPAVVSQLVDQLLGMMEATDG